MSEASHGYLGPELFDFENKYYKEFAENEYNRLYIKE